MLLTSFANPNFYGRRLKAIIEFLLNSCNKIKLVTPGHLYRHCYISNKAATESVRLQLALEYEKKYITQNIEPLSHLLDTPQFEVTTWSSIISTEEYKEQYRQIFDYCHTTEHFNDALNQTVQNFAQRGNEQPTQELRAGYKLFILEELAFFATMAKKGFPVVAYPGSSVGLDCITTKFHTENKYPHAPDYLQKVAYILMQLSKTKCKAHS